MRPNNRDTNPPPPDDSDFALDQPPTKIARDTNPPPPGESDFDIHRPSTGESQLSQSLLSNDDTVFTIIGSTHEGHSTTSPWNATVTAIAPDPAPFHNTFGPLADSDASTVDSDAQPPETTLDCDNIDEQIDDLFRDADATLAAATLDFHPVEDYLQVRLERDLTQTITTTVDLTGVKLNQALSLLQASVNNITSDLKKDIQRMDDRLAQLQGSLQHHNSSFNTAIKTISTNTSRLVEETSALSVRVVEHQSHLEHLLSFEEARQQQMDNHVKQMGKLTALISEVKSQSTTHTQRVSAQLDGLRSTMEANTTTTKADLVDIRGRLIPNLHDKTNTLASDVQRLEAQFGEQTSALALTVQRLEDRLGNFDPTDFTLTVDCFEERLDALRVALEAKTTHPCGACIPLVDVTAGAHVSPTKADDAVPRPPDIGGGRFAHIDPTFRSSSSWFARDTPRHDASAIRDSGTHTHPNAPSSTDDDTVRLMGGAHYIVPGYI